MRVLLGMMLKGEEVNMTTFQELSGISSSPTAAELRDLLVAVKLVKKDEFREDGRLNYRLSLTREGTRLAEILLEARKVIEKLPEAPASSARGLPRARPLREGRDLPKREK